MESKKQLSKYESQLSTNEEKVDAGERKCPRLGLGDAGTQGIRGHLVTFSFVCFLKNLVVLKIISRMLRENLQCVLGAT